MSFPDPSFDCRINWNHIIVGNSVNHSTALIRAHYGCMTVFYVRVQKMSRCLSLYYTITKKGDPNLKKTFFRHPKPDPVSARSFILIRESCSLSLSSSAWSG
ncbi:hypothetical protein ILYODFUR_002820 [Ilyodon furcidens]|uniref:Uncharacterized protein n=1 Tax=Ilyodon furcidens TaxID=33524 RepID=A0ABV0VC73_9TELE